MAEAVEVSGYFVVTHDELVEDVIDAYERKIPLYIWGPTGIGKSYTVKKAAKILAEKYDRIFADNIRYADSEHFLLIDRRLTMMDPTDLKGTLFKENGVSKWHFPDWLYKLSKDYEEQEGVEIRAILFLDELNLAPPLTQNAAYQLILDRRLDDLELADGVVVIAAGNTAEDRADTFELKRPLRTRFTHVTLAVPSVDQWIDWASTVGIDPRIIAFLKMFPNMLFSPNDDDRTFPTPRGWHFASVLMEGVSNDRAWRAVAKACGFIAGVQFREFLNLAKEIDIDEVLKSPTKFGEFAVDVKLSVIGAIGHRFLADPKKYGASVIKFLAYLCDSGEKELAVVLLKSIITLETKKILKEYMNKDKSSARKITSLLKFVLV